jgi:hypothetical protein
MYRMSLSTTATFGTATLERSQGLRHLNGYEIFSTCYGPPEVVRREIGSRFGWTPDQLAERLRPLVAPIDAERLGSRVDAERVLIFEAGHGDCVPATARDALWTATGRPTRITVPTTHAGAFLGLTFLRRNHMRHRDRRIPDPRPARGRLRAARHDRLGALTAVPRPRHAVGRPSRSAHSGAEGSPPGAAERLGQPQRPRSCGSSVSRRPSPSRLKPNTATMMARPGKMLIQVAVSR